jgi:hypothetical protein
MQRVSLRHFPDLLMRAMACLAPLSARAASPSNTGDTPPPLHLAPLPLNAGGTTPFSFSPAWFALIALGLPLALWAGLAWRRALDEDPSRLRRAGRRELQRLLARVRRAGGTPRSVDLHGWCQAAAHVWGVRVAAPTELQLSRALDSDASAQARWRELWTCTERSLYARNSRLPPDWMQKTAVATAQLRIPPRRNWLPNRLRHWLPSLASTLCVCAIVAGGNTASRAATDLPEGAAPMLDAKAAAALGAMQGRAGMALHADWNNWAAHFDVAAQQMVQGNSNYAMAHLTAAFLQHPSSVAVRDNLRWSLQQAGVMDPTLDRLLYGAWFQRYPSMLSPASWQRLGLVASLLIGGGLCALAVSLYMARNQSDLRRAARWTVVAGVVSLMLSVLAWNAWGDLHRRNVAMLVQEINLSPIPTDLVTEQETQSMGAGSVVLTRSSFLGWRRVQIVGLPGAVSGWTRAAAVMPLYAAD